MNDNLKKVWRCPHPFCDHKAEPLTKAEIRQHYMIKHRCGRCNAGLHRKCKKGLCGCTFSNIILQNCHTKKEVDEIILSLETTRDAKNRQVRLDQLFGKVIR